MHGYPQFSLWIFITLAKMCFPRIVKSRAKYFGMAPSLNCTAKPIFVSSFISSTLSNFEAFYTSPRVFCNTFVSGYHPNVRLHLLGSVVKRSSQQMRQNRESTLPKGIAMLVMSNLLFVFLPILSLAVWMIFINSGNDLTTLYTTIKIREWVPLYCLGIISCLNPLVNAFRNKKLKIALKITFTIS